jgi:hypothetical protein
MSARSIKIGKELCQAHSNILIIIKLLFIKLFFMLQCLFLSFIAIDWHKSLYTLPSQKSLNLLPL